MALACISLISPLAVHLFLPVIPAVKISLGLSDSVAQLTFSVALFSMAFATLFYGSLSDRFGRRPVLLSGLCLFLAGSAISAVANSVVALVLGRLVQALGAGCGITLVRAIAQDVYGASRLVKAIAYLTMAYTLGPMVAPLIGGVLVDALGWRSVSASHCWRAAPSHSARIWRYSSPADPPRPPRSAATSYRIIGPCFVIHASPRSCSKLGFAAERFWVWPRQHRV